MKIRRGDQVRVMTGKDRGKEGKVLATFPTSSRVIIEGVNLVKRHLKLRAARGRAGQEGGIITKEAPVHISNVQLVCPSCGPTRIGYQIKDGTKVRVCRKCDGEL
ncbi:MAG: 50S ribosomal protein L24, partial [Actinomycetota bacterium]